MSGIATAVVAAAVIGAGTSIYTSDRNRKAQNEAQDQAKAQAPPAGETQRGGPEQGQPAQGRPPEYLAGGPAGGQGRRRLDNAHGQRGREP